MSSFVFFSVQIVSLIGHVARYAPSSTYNLSSKKIQNLPKRINRTHLKNWIRNRYSIEFLGTWEIIHNPKFKVVEFDTLEKVQGYPLLSLALLNG